MIELLSRAALNIDDTEITMELSNLITETVVCEIVHKNLKSS